MTVGAVAYALTAPGQTAVVSVFVDPMVAELGIGRETVAAAYLIGTLAGAAGMPLVGRALDRFGARAVLLATAGLFGAVLIGMAAAAEVVGLTAGFVGIRFAGQGALTLTATTVVAYHVTHRLGAAVGIVSAAGTAGISLAPLLMERVVSTHGPSTGWFVQGVAVWAVLVPLALLGLPRRPPRAVRPEPGVASGAALGTILRTPAFWVLTAGVGALSLIVTALTFHQIDVLGERGLTSVEAAATFLPQTVAGLAATLLVGVALDRISAKPVMLGSMVMVVVALLSAGYLHPGWGAIGYGLAVGVAGNAFRTVEAAVLPRWFGTAQIGAARGVVHAVAVGASALGPLLLALGRASSDSYRPVLFGLCALPAVLAVVIVVVREPGRA
ncbi:MFS transporter [Pseudonocardia sp.]|uniref:MFS transporter n=1 Tax=Pseudonocardia sp. TaxID=60912 RepID=UPI002604D2CD|nr:MFS transporter [Pseudonocardia sp.]